MSRFLRPFIGALALGLLLVVPAKASADIFLMPFGGVTFIDDEHRKTTYGASVGFLAGIIGLEFEGARTPLGSYTGLEVVDLSARVTTYMGNVILRLPTGPIQPYASGGAGIVRLTGSVDVPFIGSVFSVSAEDFGWNAGGGLMLFPGSNVGLRADVRRFQTGDLSWEDLTDIEDLDDIPLPRVNFWRATAGITFTF
jgi:opacity protein-like surface antigen